MVRLRIRPRPSRLLVWALVAVHVAAAALAFIAVPQWAPRLLVVIAAGASLAHAVTRSALLSAGSSVAELELRGDGSAQLTLRDGRRQEARLSHSTFVSPWLAVLVLSRGGWRPARSAILLHDSLSAEDFRLLRVWLRWREAHGID